MIVVIAALSLLCLGNLLLTVGVVRRLKEHGSVLDTLTEDPQGALLPAGAVADDFAVSATDGTLITQDLIAAPTLIGFFSPTCGGCHEQLPDFVTRARRAPAGRTVAVVVDSGPTDPMVARLTGASLVVVEPPGGVLARAFGVHGYPAFALVGEGARIEVASTNLSAVPVLVGA
jgi:hypothetical protein